MLSFLPPPPPNCGWWSLNEPSKNSNYLGVFISSSPTMLSKGYVVSLRVLFQQNAWSPDSNVWPFESLPILRRRKYIYILNALQSWTVFVVFANQNTGLLLCYIDFLTVQRALTPSLVTSLQGVECRALGYMSCKMTRFYVSLKEPYKWRLKDHWVCVRCEDGWVTSGEQQEAGCLLSL